MATAATRRVGSCPGATFATIQAAVNASAGGDTVEVCPGTYPEQVTIDKNLTLVGIQSSNADAAVITSPAGGMVQNVMGVGGPAAAGIAVKSAAAVNITNVSVDGSNNLLAGCGLDLVGIFFQRASGSIKAVVTRKQTLGPGFTGCQDGEGIWVQNGTVTINDSSVHAFQKNGITANEQGTFATIAGNTIEGQGPTSGAAENGIQVGFGARGTVQSNSIIDTIWAPDTILDRGDAATGILVYASKGVTVTGNTVGNTQNGIAFVGDDQAGSADNGTITFNQVFGTHIFDGIVLCSNVNFVDDNTINHSEEAGVNLQGQEACGLTIETGNNNKVVGNSINEACAGILMSPDTSGNSLAANFFFNDCQYHLDGGFMPGRPHGCVVAQFQPSYEKVSANPLD
jgi:Periplasmic copper-binding protein (NosD)